MTLGEAAAAEGLHLLGGFHPEPGDGAPEGCGTLLLLGPDGAAFWARVTGSTEFGDGRADPLNRWSERVIGGLATRFGAGALFPFGGPPWLPFLAWAVRSGQAWASPVGLLVHARDGLFVSYRGALAFAERLDLAPAGVQPCTTCERPCVSACPVGALTEGGYDVPVCHAYLETEAGADCRMRGCAVRRACPVGQGQRPEAQSAFHMRAFHGEVRA